MGAERKPRRGSSGFRTVGDADLSGVPVSERRRRELLVVRAWRDVAGATVAERVPARAAARGVLELTAPDPRWSDELERSSRKLLRDLRRRYPELGIERLRIRSRVPETAPDSELSGSSTSPR